MGPTSGLIDMHGSSRGRHRWTIASSELLGSGVGDSESVKCSSSKQYTLENTGHCGTHSFVFSFFLYFFKFKSPFTNIGEKPWVVI